MSETLALKMAPELATALVSAQAAVRTAPKDGTNTFHHYDYSTTEGIIEVAKAALSSAGLALIPDGHHLTTDDVGAITLHSTWTVVHSSGHTHSFDGELAVLPEKGRPLDKATLASRTESLGYALRDLLQIPRKGSPDVSGRADSAPAAPAESKAAQKEQFIARSIAQAGLVGLAKGSARMESDASLPPEAKARLRVLVDQRKAQLEAAPKPAPAPPTITAGYADEFGRAKTQPEAVAIAMRAAVDPRLTDLERMTIADLAKAKASTLPAGQVSMDEAMADRETGEIDDIPF